MKITFIATVFNEEKTITKLLDSLSKQTIKPDEIIITDGGSGDKTIEKIKKYHLPIKVIMKRGNRSIGRNEAIKQATGNIILCTDAGCVLDKNWVKNITAPFVDKRTDVVAGYYKGIAETVFQKCLIPYVLVMPDKVNAKEFLPATRSMAFRKSVWNEVGRFDESLSHNEDYAFAKQLQKHKKKIFFAKNAIVQWIPRKTFKDAWKMFYRFALGDAEAGIVRSKVVLLFIRYLVGLYFLGLCVLYRSSVGLALLLFALLSYVVWAIHKNYRYVKDRQAFLYLPLLQFTADSAVMSGTIAGLLKKMKQLSFSQLIRRHIPLLIILAIYSGLVISVLHWGIPNSEHPFPYHMDEWHQLQAVRSTAKFGTPNMAGAANGTMFHFILSVLYLIPFTLVQMINPVVIKINDLLMRQRLFEILRFNTLLYGLLAITTMYIIAKKIRVSPILTISLFTFTPTWLSLSGYFKYDIALIFWITLSILSTIYYAQQPTIYRYFLAAIPAAIAVAVKVSAAPLFLVYLFVYFLFNPSWKRQLIYWWGGIAIFIGIVVLLGMPDTLFGRGNIVDYLYANLVVTPTHTASFLLPMHPYAYLYFIHYPLMYGHGLMALFILSCGLLAWQLIRQGIGKNKIIAFLFFSLVMFVLSTLSIKIDAAGNRNLVFLPYIVLITMLGIEKLFANEKFKKVTLGLVLIAFIVQVYQCFSWMYIKWSSSPQQRASIWIEQNIQPGKTIGVENIPIYQYLPHIVQKEFYFAQYGVGEKNKYRYQVVDSETKELPSIIVITNDAIEQRLLPISPKKELLEVLEKKGYRKIAIFYPDFKYYKSFATELDHYLAGIVTVPLTTSIYRK